MSIILNCIDFTVYNIGDDFLFFFFKQKTAYEMRISDWSSDVCSSDLWGALCNERERARRPGIAQSYRALTSSGSYPGWPSKLGQIGRASCRERVCQYV